MHNWNYDYNKFAFETLSDTSPLEAANKTSSSGNNSSSLFKNLFTWSDLILKILYPFNEQIKTNAGSFLSFTWGYSAAGLWLRVV